MRETSEIHFTVKHWYNFRIVIFLESILVGILAGLVVVAFRFLIGKTYHLREEFLEFISQHSPWYLVLLVFGLVLCGLFLGFLVLRYPLIRGSGIPQVKGVLLRQIESNWLPEAIFKFLGGVLGIGLGLSLGREGPSVQLGSYVGEGFADLTKRPALEKKYLISSGAAAGVAAAFNAPFAGVMFVLEELHKNFSSVLLICSMAASLSASLIAGRVFGLSPVFNFGCSSELPLRYFPYIFLLALIAALGGDLFKRGIYRSQDLYQSLKIPVILRPVLPLLLALPLGFYFMPLTGGGHHMIVGLSLTNTPVKLLLLYLVIHFLFTLFSYGSGAPGGIFLPMLVLGALIGNIYGSLLFNLGLIPQELILNFIVLGMAAYFTSVVKAPITGAVLILEMSGSFNQFLGLVTVCLLAYVFTDLIKSKPVYDTLLDRLVERNPQIFKGDSGKRVILEVPVGAGSFLEHKRVKDVTWPQDLLIIGIRRGEREIIPRGDTELYQGDILHILTQEQDAARYKQDLLALGILKD